jgi:hypothetical protein
MNIRFLTKEDQLVSLAVSNLKYTGLDTLDPEEYQVLVRLLENKFYTVEEKSVLLGLNLHCLSAVGLSEKYIRKFAIEELKIADFESFEASLPIEARCARSLFGRIRTHLLVHESIIFGFPLYVYGQQIFPRLEPIPEAVLENAKYYIAQCHKINAAIEFLPKAMGTMGKVDEDDISNETFYQSLRLLLWHRELDREFVINNSKLVPIWFALRVMDIKWESMPRLHFLYSVPKELGFYELLALYPVGFQKWLGEKGFLNGYPITWESYLKLQEENNMELQQRADELDTDENRQAKEWFKSIHDEG